MSSKLTPQNPSDVTVIRKVTENITTFSAPFARFGQAKIGGRATVGKGNFCFEIASTVFFEIDWN